MNALHICVYSNMISSLYSAQLYNVTQQCYSTLWHMKTNSSTMMAMAIYKCVIWNRVLTDPLFLGLMFKLWFHVCKCFQHLFWDFQFTDMIFQLYQSHVIHYVITIWRINMQRINTCMYIHIVNLLPSQSFAKSNHHPQCIVCRACWPFRFRCQLHLSCQCCWSVTPF